MIVKKAGKSIKEIFEREGEDAFRDLETEAIREALALSDHVISLGGGAVLREENRTLLKQASLKVIYLKCDPEVLVQRIQADTATAANRPNLTNLGGGIDEVRQVLSVREPLYRATMTSELEVTNLSPEDAVVYIARML